MPRERECESKVEVSKNTHKCLAESKIMKSMTCCGFILNAKEVSWSESYFEINFVTLENLNDLCNIEFATIAIWLWN